MFIIDEVLLSFVLRLPFTCLPLCRNEPSGCEMQVAEFYKAWDRYGVLSNFSAHPIQVPQGPIRASGSLPNGPLREWPSVEHFYQAQKFTGAAQFQPPKSCQSPS